MQVPIKPQSTLDAIAKIKESKKDDYIRPYLGMSGIGSPCDRENYADFRWLTKRKDPAWLSDAANCGYIAEDEMAKDLRLLPDATLITEGFSNENKDNSASQIEFSDHNGHFKGHADGVILGILEAPKAWHVWEHKDKCIRKKGGADKFNELMDLIEKYGEKEALEQWDYTYYVQAQLYMHYSGYKRHYLTVTRGVKRQYISVRTEYSKTTALRYIEKAHNVITANNPPDRRYKETYWYCKHFCNHFDWCHKEKPPEKTCRSCKHSVAIMDKEHSGLWGCKKLIQVMNPQMQKDMEMCRGQEWEGIG